MHKAPTSYKTTPEPSTGHKTVAAVPQGYASPFDCYNLAGGEDEPPVPREANIVPFEMRKGMAHMLGEIIALLAMKQRRAPLPVSPALLKSLWLRGFPENWGELESFARRFLFLGDERMLLAELRRGPVPTACQTETSPGRPGIAAERTESKGGQECQCIPTN